MEWLGVMPEKGLTLETDIELLKAAAKAAGLLDEPHDWKHGILRLLRPSGTVYWSALFDDGDALWLAVKCGIDFYEGDDDGRAAYAGYYDKTPRQRFCIERHDAHQDEFAATRRAIVRAAAAMADC